MISEYSQIVPIWNTTIGSDGRKSYFTVNVGSYLQSEPPNNLFDGNLSSAYTNYGNCEQGSGATQNCGINTGFYINSSSDPYSLVAFRLATSSYSPEKDPIFVSIEGSNNISGDLNRDTSWNLIYYGISGLSNNPGRSAYGATIYVEQSIAYRSFRFLVLSKRGTQNSVSYSEVQFIVYNNPIGF